MPSQVAEFVVRVLRCLIGNPVSFLARPPDAKDHDLLINSAGWGTESINGLVAKVWGQDLPAFINAIKRNDHDKHAAGLQPAKELLEEYGLHALILAFAHFEIIRGVQIQERKGFNGCVALKCAALDDLVGARVSLGRAVRVQFQSISANAISCGNRRQCDAGSRARIQHRCFQSGKMQPTRDSLGLFIRKRVIAKFEACLWTQIVSPFLRRPMMPTRVESAIAGGLRLEFVTYL